MTEESSSKRKLKLSDGRSVEVSTSSEDVGLEAIVKMPYGRPTMEGDPNDGLLMPGIYVRREGTQTTITISIKSDTFWSLYELINNMARDSGELG